MTPSAGGEHREGRTMADEAIPRRQFLKSAAVAGTVAATAMTPPTPPQTQSAQPPHPAASAPAASAASEAMLTLTPTEAAFFSAVADTIILADTLSPLG